MTLKSHPVLDDNLYRHSFFLDRRLLNRLHASMFFINDALSHPCPFEESYSVSQMVHETRTRTQIQMQRTLPICLHLFNFFIFFFIKSNHSFVQVRFFFLPICLRTTAAADYYPVMHIRRFCIRLVVSIQATSHLS